MDTPAISPSSERADTLSEEPMLAAEVPQSLAPQSKAPKAISDPRLSVKPLQRKERSGQPLDPSISEELVSRLVETFYARVRQHPRLDVLFSMGMSQEWPEHMEQMKGFWRSLLMQTREYEGRPVPAHMKLQGLEPEDFADWLTLFRQTARELCEPAAAALFINRAETIAKSLQMAVFLKGMVAPMGAFEDGVMRPEIIAAYRAQNG